MNEIERLTLDEIRAKITYNPETGIFRWASGSRWAGKEAGHTMKDGYRRISLTDSDKRSAHRLAWLMTYGSLPERGIDIDHKNGDRADNRIENLRLATRGQNSSNARLGKRNSTGLKGVSFDRRSGKFRAQIMFNRKTIFLGYFIDPEEAHQAYIDAAKLVRKGFAHSGEQNSELFRNFQK